MGIGAPMELLTDWDDKWVVRKGHFLGVLVCNHSLMTVQSLMLHQAKRVYVLLNEEKLQKHMLVLPLS
jgi:hypothetical protein